MAQDSIWIDPKSGFCKSNSIFYSKRKPITLPSNESLDITAFISSKSHHGKIAYIDAATGNYLTFSELWKAVDSVSNCLSVDHQIRRGDVVLLLSPNSIFYPVICLSVMSLGAIITTTNPLNTPQEIGKQIADSKPVLAFTTQSLVPKLAKANDNLPIVVIGESTESNINEARIVCSLQEMLKKEPSRTRVKERVSHDDTATLLYSSGTTGVSKGVISSHRNLIAMVQTLAIRFRSNDGDPGQNQTYVCIIPMFHIYGLCLFTLAFLAFGSTMIIHSRFALDEMLSSIDKYKATSIPLAPPVLMALIDNADKIRGQYDLGSLQAVLSGGAPLSKEVIEEFVGRYPNVTILQGYALTETAGIGASMDTVEESRRYGTTGLLSAGIEAKIVDVGSGQSLSVNRTGELWLRGPSVMKGYFNNPEATTSTLNSEGWLRTGDICYIDHDGYVSVVDRLKELIKYKGYQVPPAELEALLLSHPEIADAGVIPFPDKEAGQYPMAYIVRKAGSDLSDSAVIDFVAKQVASYKTIRRVAFVSAIPKNPSGKILRKVLIKIATSKL